MKIKLKRNIFIEDASHFEKEVVDVNDTKLANKLITLDYAEAANPDTETDPELDKLVKEIRTEKTTGKK